MSRQIKVGLFILAGLVVAGVLIFLVGQQRHLFTRQARLFITFHDVAGLAPGSPVRMGGVDIGQVDSITFSDSPADRTLHVEVTIVAAELPRVRGDSIARIASKGLLGDKALEITMGSVRAAAIRDEGTIQGEETEDMGVAIRNAGQAVTRANQVLANIQTATQPLANPQLGNDLIGLVHDLREVSHAVAQGPGTVHSLLVDNSAAQRLDATLAATQTAANRAASSLADVESIAREARTGHGLIHALVYDRQGETMVRSIAGLANELGTITHDVRTGPGGLHQIIYGNDSGEAVANINRATADLRDILHDVRAGRGTVGALLVDPSLYEDIKGLVGNLQRNEILRAMVRYSIHQDETPQSPPAVHPGR